MQPLARSPHHSNTFFSLSLFCSISFFLSLSTWIVRLSHQISAIFFYFILFYISFWIVCFSHHFSTLSLSFSIYLSFISLSLSLLLSPLFLSQFACFHQWINPFYSFFVDSFPLSTDNFFKIRLSDCHL